jgi:hypothetical protein
MNAEIKNIEGVVSMLDEHSSSYRAHGSAHFESIRMKHPSVADYERMLELSQDRTDVRVEVMHQRAVKKMSLSFWTHY